MNSIELVTYNRLLKKSTDELINIYLGNNPFLTSLSGDILIRFDRLLCHTLSFDKLILVIDCLSLDSLWILASKSKDFMASRISYNRLMKIIDDSECELKRSLLKVL